MTTKAAEAARRARVAREYEVRRDLADALVQAITAAHDGGRVASGGKLHPSPSYHDCPSILCENTRQTLAESGVVSTGG